MFVADCSNEPRAIARVLRQHAEELVEVAEPLLELLCDLDDQQLVSSNLGIERGGDRLLIGELRVGLRQPRGLLSLVAAKFLDPLPECRGVLRRAFLYLPQNLR